MNGSVAVERKRVDHLQGYARRVIQRSETGKRVGQWGAEGTENDPAGPLSQPISLSRSVKMPEDTPPPFRILISPPALSSPTCRYHWPGDRLRVTIIETGLGVLAQVVKGCRLARHGLAAPGDTPISKQCVGERVLMVG